MSQELGQRAAVAESPLDQVRRHLGAMLFPGQFGPGLATPDRPRVPPSRWETKYRAMVASTDIASAALSAGVVHLTVRAEPGYPVVGIVAAVVAVASLVLCGAWETSTLRRGGTGFGRLVHASGMTAVLLGLGGLAASALEVRPWVFVFVPLDLLVSLLARRPLQRSLHRKRIRGRCLRPVLAVGSVESMRKLVERTRRHGYAGWVVAGACLPSGTHPPGSSVDGVPVLGTVESAALVAAKGHYHAVAVSRDTDWRPETLEAVWRDLRAIGTELLVDPGLTHTCGPALRVAPVDALPLLRLGLPSTGRTAQKVKSVLDRAGAAALLLLAAPLMLAVAAAVRTDGGPVFYRQTRVGRHGELFSMAKFRSMVPNADELKASFAAKNDGSGPLFKLRRDPRVTRVGGVLRRLSLDELPQLFNVLTGKMSLVGPRPPLPEEVATYAGDAAHRFVVKPGITGLWQVSGRSDLSWQESVQLDLRYVESWSLGLDFRILWQTAGAVLRRTGAY
ncbi:sugar transferase [Amycolatopsis sp. GM8]|uniref:sugar transferase n=1 Tax=Amycolatopsis sp. GM8 TaxID=2896530 RepID=UPI001F1FBBE5|nr:sugar transferase [Amycolatopsis sp. GM8]